MIVDEYNALREKQGFACAICLKIPHKKLCIDHDHTTGNVRSLLCNHYNVAIGYLTDSPELCLAAASYLTRWALTYVI